MTIESIEKTKALVKINPLADPAYEALKVEITKICEGIVSRELHSQDDVRNVTEDVNLAQQIAKQCESLRKEYKDPLVQHGKTIDAAFKALTNPIENARNAASNNIGDYNRQQREKQRLIDEENARLAREQAEMQRMIDEENERLRREAEESGSRTVDEEGTITEQAPIEYIQPEPEPEYIPPEPIVSRALTGTGSATEKMVPHFRLFDIKQVPSNLVLLNEKAVNAMLKAGIREIEGLEIWEEPEVKFRSN